MGKWVTNMPADADGEHPLSVSIEDVYDAEDDAAQQIVAIRDAGDVGGVTVYDRTQMKQLIAALKRAYALAAWEGSGK